MKDMSLLVVDEDPAALGEIADIMGGLGFTAVTQSDSAVNAWMTIQLKGIECLICAWEMPDMSGLSLLKIVRTSDKFMNLPVFLTHSAYTEGMVVVAGREGVTGLMVRPFGQNNIRSKMEALQSQVADPAQKETEDALASALKLIESESYGTALGILENLTKREENPEYHYNVGYIKAAQGHYTEAIQAFKKAADIDRLFAKAFEGMGRAYRKLGKPEEAEKYMIRAADIHMSKENVEEAEAVLEEIKEINPDTVNIYNSLGVLYRKKNDYEKALYNYKKALVIHPDRARIHYNIGRIYIEMKDLELAKPCFVKALKLDPDFSDAKEVLDAIELGAFF
ncbi:MAG: tetratricopeptide repeat protein [Desulfobacterales bacterium]